MTDPRISSLVHRISEISTRREAQLLEYDVSQDTVTLALVYALTRALERAEAAEEEVMQMQREMELTEVPL